LGVVKRNFGEEDAVEDPEKDGKIKLEEPQQALGPSA
jgi:hypothetical protein